MRYLICAILGYLVGSVNPSYFIAKKKGIDIKKSGSGNAGASNAVITMGGKIGTICMIFDIAKAFAVVEIIQRLFPGDYHAAVIAGLLCILGHIFPFYMKFKGGKGLACLGGCIMGYSVKVFIIMLAIALILVLVTDYICVAPIAASVVFPVTYGVIENDWWGVLIMAIGSIAMLYKHIENLKRISLGTEAHFSYIWKKDEETERVRKNREGM